MLLLLFILSCIVMANEQGISLFTPKRNGQKTISKKKTFTIVEYYLQTLLQ